MSKLVTIIVPVYNAEKYLDKCITSLVNQTYKNLEIILVDDESPDNCPKLCDEWTKKDQRIKVIHKKNGGVSSARNMGLEIAKGEYILFIDSDDYIEINCLEECMKIIEKYNLDIIKFGYQKELNHYFRKNKFTVPVNRCIEESEYNKLIYKYILTTPDFYNIWNAIIRKQICQENKFDTSLTMGEDYLYFVRCVSKSQKIYFLDSCFYHYIINNDSITHKFNIEKNVNKLKNCLTANLKIQEIINKKNYFNENDYIIQSIKNFNSSIYHCIKKCNYKDYCYYIDKIKNDVFLDKLILELFVYLPKETKHLLNKERKYFYFLKIKFGVKLILKSIIEKIK